MLLILKNKFKNLPFRLSNFTARHKHKRNENISLHKTYIQMSKVALVVIDKSWK